MATGRLILILCTCLILIVYAYETPTYFSTSTAASDDRKPWEVIKNEAKWILDKPGVVSDEPWEAHIFGGLGLGNGTMKTTESGKPTYYGCTGSVVVNRKSDNTPVLLTSPACVGIKTSMAYQPATMIHEGGKIGNVVFRKNNEYVACALVEMRFRDGATHLESWFGRISSFRTSLRDGDLVKKSGAGTGLTQGLIVDQQFGNVKTHGFEKHIVVESRNPSLPFCNQADFGALLLSRKDNEAIGMIRGVSEDGRFCVVSSWFEILKRCDIVDIEPVPPTRLGRALNYPDKDKFQGSL